LPHYHNFLEHLRVRDASADRIELRSVSHLLHHWRHLSGRVHGRLPQLQLARLRVVRGRAAAGLCVDVLFCGKFAAVYHYEYL
jgi:hypothetical protein